MTSADLRPPRTARRPLRRTALRRSAVQDVEDKVAAWSRSLKKLRIGFEEGKLEFNPTYKYHADGHECVARIVLCA